jgi:hypothetical protein
MIAKLTIIFFVNIELQLPYRKKIFRLMLCIIIPLVICCTPNPDTGTCLFCIALQCLANCGVCEGSAISRTTSVANNKLPIDPPINITIER